MRTQIVPSGSGELTYEIRNIVNVAEKLQKCGVTVNWENIGDPIVKGEQIPEWMKKIVADAVMKNDSWAYCHTRGVLKTREFLCQKTNNRSGAQITPEDIIFFNGLGDAISNIYGCLAPTARVLMPSPTYTTHTLGEIGHAKGPAIHFTLNPQDGWKPDLAEIREKVQKNPEICAIMIINPDNPTGMVYPKDTLKAIVDIAREFGLFIIADEVYNNIVYNGQKTVPISDVIGDLPGISLKGISKEFPWPGSRCGWIEVYNADKDEQFSRYINVILTAKMNEVCSTTLPQVVIPDIMQHPQYEDYLQERIRLYETSSNITCQYLQEVPQLLVNRTNGAFYMSVAFKDGVLNNKQSLPIENGDVRTLVESLVNQPGVSADKRFVYYTLAATGICTVPLSSFATDLQGFRVTLLERDPKETERIYQTLASKIKEYVAS